LEAEKKAFGIGGKVKRMKGQSVPAVSTPKSKETKCKTRGITRTRGGAEQERLVAMPEKLRSKRKNCEGGEDLKALGRKEVTGKDRGLRQDS